MCKDAFTPDAQADALSLSISSQSLSLSLSIAFTPDVKADAPPDIRVGRGVARQARTGQGPPFTNVVNQSLI